MPRRRSSSSDSSRSSDSDSRSSGSGRRRSPTPQQRQRRSPEPKAAEGVVHRLGNEDEAPRRSRREDHEGERRGSRYDRPREGSEERYRNQEHRETSSRGEERYHRGRPGLNGRHEQGNDGPRGRGSTRYDGPVRSSGAEAAKSSEPDGDSQARGGITTEVKDKAPGKKEAAPGKSGGVYIPPFKLAQMMKECEDKVSPEYQRMTWDALRKSINGLVNKVNASNIKHILPEMFSENLIRGRGLFCRSVMKSQMASPAFTPVYAALVAVINTKFPELGELLLGRVILQFRRAYKRNDKSVCLAATKMIAHLVNQQVAHELIALEMLMLLLETPSDDGVEVAVGFVKEVGACLSELSPQGLHSVFERFRGILHEGEIDKRVQFMIEGVFAIRKAGFDASGHPSIPENLDLVESEDQITHELSIDSEVNASTSLDVFKVDPDYQQHEDEYEAIKKEILGDEDSDEDSEDGSDEEDDDESDEEDAAAKVGAAAAPTQQRITDATQTNLVNLRRTIYLTIMSSMDFEEAGHKLLKIQLAPGQEQELITMIIECCSQERTYMRYYGLLAQRFCYLNRIYQEIFEDAFQRQYALIHRLETGKLRNTAKLFAHLLGTDALSWVVMSNIRLTEDDTTSSSRIFVKILFQELSENLGLVKLNERLNDPSCQEWFAGIFPKDAARNLRFSINFFTSIGLGGLTDASREFLKNIPKMIAQQQKPESDSDSSDSDSDSDSDSGSSSDSDSSGSSSSSGSDSSGSSSSSGSDSEASSPPRKTSRKRQPRSRSPRSPQRKRHR